MIREKSHLFLQESVLLLRGVGMENTEQNIHQSSSFNSLYHQNTSMKITKQRPYIVLFQFGNIQAIHYVSLKSSLKKNAF